MANLLVGYKSKYLQSLKSPVIAFGSRQGVYIIDDDVHDFVDKALKSWLRFQPIPEQRLAQTLGG